MKYVLLAVIVFLQGCSSTVPCTESEKQAIRTKDAMLNAEKKVLEGYRNGGVIVPGLVHSSLQKGNLISALEQSYNRSVDELNDRADTCNAQTKRLAQH